MDPRDDIHLIVDWTEAFPVRTGLDQLGIRGASEDQYTQLVDFTTTVTWHPRYYSFLAWATRRAIQLASGPKGVERHAWQRTVRRLDYLLAAATLAESPDAKAIIGSDKLRSRVARIAKGGVLDITGDHVGDGSGTGSLAVYGGSMEALGLIAQKSGVSGPTPLGDRLADAFERCVAACALDGRPDLASITAIDIAQLRALARGCGIDQLGTAAGTSGEVTAERDLLRAHIIDWPAFDQPQVRRRVQSIAVILACHALTAGDTTLATFRAAILTGGVRGHGPLVMTAAFDDVRRCWRMYQVHAYVVFALESFLALALQQLAAAAPRRRVHRDMLLSELLGLVVSGPAQATALPAELALFWQQPLDHVLDQLDPIVRAGWDVDAEPAVDARLRARLGGGRFRDPAGAAHDAALLLLLSLARLRSLRGDIEHSWIASAAPWRRPPAALLAHVDRALAHRPTTQAYFRTVIDELVLRQHTTNAHRKLAEQHRQSTALFQADADDLELVALHVPGTTNPRFDNATWYLADLGYLDRTTHAITADGKALLDAITHRSAT